MSEADEQNIEEQKQEDAAKESSREELSSYDKTKIGGWASTGDDSGESSQDQGNEGSARRADEGPSDIWRDYEVPWSSYDGLPTGDPASDFQDITSGGDDPRAAFGPNTDLGTSGPSREDYIGKGMISDNALSEAIREAEQQYGVDLDGSDADAGPADAGPELVDNNRFVWRIKEDTGGEVEEAPKVTREVYDAKADRSLSQQISDSWDALVRFFTTPAQINDSPDGGTPDGGTPDSGTSPVEDPGGPDSGVVPGGYGPRPDLPEGFGGRGPKGGETVNPDDQDTGSGWVDPSIIGKLGQQAQKHMVGQPADPEGGGRGGGTPSLDTGRGEQILPSPDDASGPTGGEGDLPPGFDNPEDRGNDLPNGSPGDPDVPQSADEGGGSISREVKDLWGNRVASPGSSAVEGSDLKERVENAQEQIDKAQNPQHMAEPKVLNPNANGIPDNGLINVIGPNPDILDEGADVGYVDAEEFERATGVNPEEDRLADDPRDYVKPAVPPESTDEVGSDVVNAINQDPSENPAEDFAEAGEPTLADLFPPDTDGDGVSDEDEAATVVDAAQDPEIASGIEDAARAAALRAQFDGRLLADDPREQVSGPPPELLADTQTSWSASEERQGGEEQRDSSSGGDSGQDVPEISEQPLSPAGYALGPETGSSGVEEWGGVPLVPEAEDMLGVAGQEVYKAGPSDTGEEIPSLPSEIPSDDDAGGGYDLTNVSRQVDASYDPTAFLHYQEEQEDNNTVDDDFGI